MMKGASAPFNVQQLQENYSKVGVFRKVWIASHLLGSHTITFTIHTAGMVVPC